MSADDAVREQILSALRSATDRRFEEAVRDFPAQFMNVKPPNVDYTPWQLLEHLRISQLDILEYIRNPDYKSPPWPEGYWPAGGTTADTAAWAASIEGFRRDRSDFDKLVADPNTDLTALMPRTPGHTVLREVLLNIGHSSVHVGEFGILRQVMRTWPKERG
jgi:hypothetical protein